LLHSLRQGEAICATATPPGRSAVAIVRMSGLGVVTIANKVTHKKLLPRQATHTSFYDSDNKIIDQGIAIYFQTPASFTGEDMVELHCHGNPIISSLLLKTLCEHGSRLATPGEFSLRAFLNNKIDLARAEAIADLINSTTEQGVRTATRSLQGAFSSRVQSVLAKLILIRTNVEACLDFPDEEIDAKQSKNIGVKLVNLEAEITELLRQAQQGERLQTGATIAIAGKPNTGKSSLLNMLAQSDVAIVTEVPGTTRDPLTADIELQGMPVRLIDTAGLRETKDVVEEKGIELAQRALSQADIILWLTDISKKAESLSIPGNLDENKVIKVYNKIDLTNIQAQADNSQVYLSAKTGSGLSGLFAVLAQRLRGDEQGDTPFLARHRHLIALQQAQEHIHKARQFVSRSTELELVAEDLRLAQQSLGEVTGEFTSDDLLGKIFSEFCIGK
jgi:tRNA modification GTPase